MAKRKKEAGQSPPFFFQRKFSNRLSELCPPARSNPAFLRVLSLWLSAGMLVRRGRC